MQCLLSLGSWLVCIAAWQYGQAKAALVSFLDFCLFWCWTLSCATSKFSMLQLQAGYPDKQHGRYNIFVWQKGMNGSNKLLSTHFMRRFMIGQTNNLRLSSGGNDGRRDERRVKPGELERGGRRLIKPTCRWDPIKTLILKSLFLDVWLTFLLCKGAAGDQRGVGSDIDPRAEDWWGRQRWPGLHSQLPSSS